MPTRQRVATPLPITVDAATEALLAGLGRTEGAAISPDGRRIAIVGSWGAVLVAGVRVERTPDGQVSSVAVSDGGLVQLPRHPQVHGVAFGDDGLLVLADRESGVSVHRLARAVDDAGPVRRLPSTELLDVSVASSVAGRSAGAVAIRPAGGQGGLVDLVVVEGSRRRAVRHLVAIGGGDDEARVIDTEVLDDLGGLPDGVALTPCGEWMAVSLHDGGGVALARTTEGSLPRRAVPGTREGWLGSLEHPHGTVFVHDGRVALVTEAGRPLVAVFRSDDGDWSGTRAPDAVVQVMDDVVFERGHVDGVNGGPKGIAAHEGLGIVVLSAAAQRLAVFAIDDLCGPPDPAPSASRSARDAEAELRARLLRRTAERNATAVADLQRLGEGRRTVAAALWLLGRLERSWPWRLALWLVWGRRARRDERRRVADEHTVIRRVG